MGTDNRYAYLFGAIDTRTIPPTFLGADIFSEETPTLGSRFSFVILSASGGDYEKAVSNLRKRVKQSPEYSWCRPYITASRVALKKQCPKRGTKQNPFNVGEGVILKRQRIEGVVLAVKLHQLSMPHERQWAPIRYKVEDERGRVQWLYSRDLEEMKRNGGTR